MNGLDSLLRLDLRFDWIGLHGLDWMVRKEKH